MLDATSGRECDPLAVDRNETTGKRYDTHNFEISLTNSGFDYDSF